MGRKVRRHSGAVDFFVAMRLARPTSLRVAAGLATRSESEKQNPALGC